MLAGLKPRKGREHAGDTPTPTHRRRQRYGTRNSRGGSIWGKNPDYADLSDRKGINGMWHRFEAAAIAAGCRSASNSRLFPG